MWQYFMHGINYKAYCDVSSGCVFGSEICIARGGDTGGLTLQMIPPEVLQESRGISYTAEERARAARQVARFDIQDAPVEDRPPMYCNGAPLSRHDSCGAHGHR